MLKREIHPFSRQRKTEKNHYQNLFLDLYKIQPQVERYLYKFTGQRELAQDLCQEAYTRLFCALQKSAPGQNDFEANKPRFYKWLYTIARNLYIDNARRARHEKDAGKLQDYYDRYKDCVDVNIEDDLLRKDLAEKIEQSLRLLPEEIQAVFKECVIDKAPREEVSSRYAISLSTLKRRLRAAKQLMSQNLREYGRHFQGQLAG